MVLQICCVFNFFTGFNLTRRGIDYALANGETPLKANELPTLMKQVICTG